MRKQYLIAMALSVCTPIAAAADEQEYGPAFSSCMDNSGGTTAAMLDCLGAEYDRQDARLNKAYKVLMAELSSERKQQLQDAQRLWIKYRDANCAFYYDPNGGSMAHLAGNDCMLSMTAKRATELELLREE